MPLPYRLSELVARQDGVVSREQAVACGVPTRTVSHWASAGTWRRLHPRVFLVDGHRLTDSAYVRAAQLWAGTAAVVSGPTAAWWHGLYDRPLPAHITVPAGWKRAPREGIVLRRRDLPRQDRTFRRSLAVVSVPLAVLETAVTLPDGSRILDRALQRRVPLADLRRCHQRNHGLTGSPAMARLLAAAGGTESAAEDLLVALLRRAGVTGWVTNHPFRSYRIDVAFPVEKVAVEVDGWAWHSDVERFQADRRKGNALVEGRWTLLRFTWHDLDGRPDACVETIRRAIRR